MLPFVGLLLLATSGYALGECSGGCKEPTLLYEDLQCKPVYASPNDCCPSEYDCSHIEERARLKEEKCYFHGRAYNIGDNVDDDEVYGGCQVGCTCRKKQSGNMGFTCAILDCPEWLGRNEKPGCHLAYELDKCCGVGEICPPFSTTCEVDGKTYRQGQKFGAPNAKCTECVCQAGFEGKFAAPFCKKRTCIEEITQHNEIYNFCAPSYISKDDCCPFNWICHENDNIVPAAIPAKNSGLQCKFGENALNIGDKFERSSENGGKLSCECTIPPYLTCIQNYQYPAYAPEY